MKDFYIEGLGMKKSDWVKSRLDFWESQIAWYNKEIKWCREHGYDTKHYISERSKCYRRKRRYIVQLEAIK